MYSGNRHYILRTLPRWVNSLCALRFFAGIIAGSGRYRRYKEATAAVLEVCRRHAIEGTLPHKTVRASGHIMRCRLCRVCNHVVPTLMEAR